MPDVRSRPGGDHRHADLPLERRPGPDGTVDDWAGNDTDTQNTLYQEEAPVLVCGDGHAYTHPRFTDTVMSTLRITEGTDDDDDNG